MVSEYLAEEAVSHRQQELFHSADLRSGVSSPEYDVSADGRRFLTSAPAEQSAEVTMPTIRIVQNWYEEFRDRER